jgi:hypothetical protein
MSKGFWVIVIILGLLLALEVDVRGIIGLAALLLIMGAALTSILTGRIPRPLLLSVAVVIIGLIVTCCIIKALFAQFQGFLKPTTGSGALSVLILAGLMATSFLYVHARLRAGRQHHQRELHTNERQPLPPAPYDDGEEH